MKSRHHAENLIAIGTQHHRSTVDAEQIAHVETADKGHTHFAPVDFEQHSLDALLDDATFEVGCRACAVGFDVAYTVLHHDHAVFVVGVGHGKGRFAQIVEEHLFGVAVVLESAVIVEVVAREVGEESPFEMQTADAMLVNGVRRAFHKGIIAAGLDHFCQKCVEFDRIGGGVRGFHGAVVNIVAHRRHKSHLVTQSSVELVEHRGHGGFSVGAGHSDEAQFVRRVAIKPCGNGAHELFRVGNAHHCGGFGRIDGFADHKCGSAVFNGLVHKCVAVGLRAFHGHK